MAPAEPLPRIALAAAAALLLWRILALWLDQTDLFVDEAQYWLWGQDLEAGYYSKPPLIAWLLRGVTDLVGSSERFWVRLPAPLLHGITAVLIFVLTRPLGGARAAALAAVAYLSLPILAVGSYMISTDTVMAPFFVLGLIGYQRLLRGAGAATALWTGAAVGAAVMAKYAGVYFFLGAGILAIFTGQRPSLRDIALILLAFAVVISPNVIWNITHGFTTVSHTIDNADWVDDAKPLAGVSLAAMGSFLASQIAVFGPVFAGVFLWLIPRRKTADEARLLSFALPVLLLVSVQALLSGAYANWAFATYLSATPLVVLWLLRHGRERLLAVGIALNMTIGFVVPLLYVAPELMARDGTPLIARYMGRAEISRQILAHAADDGVPVVAENRDILADLLHTGRDGAVPVFARTRPGPARHYYDQKFAYAPQPGPVLYIGTLPEGCSGQERAVDFSASPYARLGLRAHLVDGACLR